MALFLATGGSTNNLFMLSFFDGVKLCLGFLRFGPHLALRLAHSNARVLVADETRWRQIYLSARGWGATCSFVWLMWHFPEFRNVVHMRLGRAGTLLSCLTPGERTLFFATPQIGPGLFVQHGFATIVTARSIGKNCWINQQVTIGYSAGSGCPRIGDDVTVNAGAKVLGGIEVGDRVVIGANAVVTKNVPPDVTVAGVPARIIRRGGVRVDEPL